MEGLLTVKHVARLLNVTTRRIYDLVESRDDDLRLPATRIGRTLRFRPADIETYVTDHSS